MEGNKDSSPEESNNGIEYNHSYSIEVSFIVFNVPNL